MIGKALVTAMAPFALTAGVVIPQPPSLHDGYVFEQKEFTRPAMILFVHEYRTRSELHDTYQRIYPLAPRPTGLLAFARWNAEACEIHILDPGYQYEPHVMGHEVAHCIHGNFHPNQPRKLP